ncbi:LETM1 domain-containing protein 1 [Sitophilus oryzae]|uniref:LETM1 domain-containing protein 1 n=1 Tax=Sitophilus oryzae TaxID=7048 RepID=A0A6J2XG03_SITOR|nr:LETM1 domain-containing protein 1 [Sitophilus oryzae]
MALSLVLRSQKIIGLSRVVPPLIYPSCNKFYQVREVHRKSVYKTEEAKKVRFYILNRFVDFLKNYDQILEKNFPTTMKTYKVFMEGIKDFITEMREYFKIVRMLNSSAGSYTKLLRREIELYYQMPKDMFKVAPTLIFSTLPFAFYVLLPLIYAFPKQLLTPHFWTLEQRAKFKTEYLHDRLVHNKPVFRHLQLQLNFIKHNKDSCIYETWSKVLGQLGSGVQPTVEDILSCKDLFMDEPYHLLYLSRNHILHLVKIHNIHPGWFRRTRLADRALILIEMDKAIMREGGVHNLPSEALKTACYIRGLNPTNVDEKYLVKWLSQWIKISNEINKENLSLLLHCPILLGYNEPSNWSLIYPKK